MNQLPFDYARCKPVDPDRNCRNCKRWAELPGQTFSERTCIVVTTNSRNPACIHITLSELEAKR